MVESVRTQNRAKILSAFIAIALLLCVIALAKVQIIDAAALSETVHARLTRSDVIPAERGQITDAKGTVLASSQRVYDVGVMPYLIADYKHVEWVNKNGEVVAQPTAAQKQSGEVKKEIVGRGAAEAAKLLAPILGMDRGELGGKMIGNYKYYLVKRNVPAETWRKIEALHIPGIQGDPSYQRVYPNGNVASTVIGFASEDRGLAGVEATQNSLLQGKPGQIVAERAPGGEILPGTTSKDIPATPGATVRLTIDADLNNFAQQQADETCRKYKADWVSIVVEQVGTGKILALADSGEVDPDSARNGKGLAASRATQYTYEPGSVGKVLTFAAALEKQKVTPLSPFTVPSTISMPNGQSFRDSHYHEVQHLTATGVLAYSSNVGTVQIGDRVTDQYRYELMHKLGWGVPTGIEMPGETQGVIAPWNKWDGRQRYTTMFGQGLAVSPVQTTTMMATIANYGVRVPVTIIAGHTDPNGVYVPNPPGKPERVMNANNAATLLRMMESVTDEGYSLDARVPGYRTGGKSGTTEILTGDGGSVASFSGFAPAEHPQVATTVVVYRPRTVIWGGEVAGPAFSRVTERALQLLGVPPSTEPAKLYPKTTDGKG